MSVDGTWNIIINTPMGKQKAVLDLVSESDKLTGTGKAMGSSMEIADGTVDGSAVSFSMRVSKPIPMTLKFHLLISGSAIEGDVVAGPLGKQKVTGSRA